MMTATEELRRMLDERGVEWKCYGYENHTWWGEWHAENRASVNGLFLKVEAVITPEQAIEATLGRGTCHDEGDPGDFFCSECGVRMFTETNDTYTMIASDERTIIKHPNYCPNCGRRVVAGEDA